MKTKREAPAKKSSRRGEAIVPWASGRRQAAKSGRQAAPSSRRLRGEPPYTRKTTTGSQAPSHATPEGNTKSSRGLAPPGPPQEAKAQGIKIQSSVLATRNPRPLSFRFAEPFLSGWPNAGAMDRLYHEPPRNTRPSQSLDPNPHRPDDGPRIHHQPHTHPTRQTSPRTHPPQMTSLSSPDALAPHGYADPPPTTDSPSGNYPTEPPPSQGRPRSPGRYRRACTPPPRPHPT